MARLPSDDLGDRDAFVLGLVREHRPGDDVADGEDAGDVRLIVTVDEHALFRIKRDPGFG